MRRCPVSRDLWHVTCQELAIGMTQQPGRQHGAITTRAAVAARIEARLAGRLTDAALAAWAFDRFYAEE